MGNKEGSLQTDYCDGGEHRQPVQGVCKFFDIGAWYTNRFHYLELVCEAGRFCDNLALFGLGLVNDSNFTRSGGLRVLFLGSLVELSLDLLVSLEILAKELYFPDDLVCGCL